MNDLCFVGDFYETFARNCDWHPESDVDEVLHFVAVFNFSFGDPLNNVI
jgi:hypothetical protein